MADIVFWDPGAPTSAFDPSNPGAQASRGYLYDAGQASPAWSSWDVIFFGGVACPGIASVSGDKGQKIDQRSGFGEDGATLTHGGAEPCPVTVKLTMWTPQHLRDWVALVPFIQQKPGKAKPKPVRVSHPGLSLMGIKSLYVQSIGIPSPSPIKGAKEVTIKLVEFLPNAGGGILTPGGSTDLKTGKQAFPGASGTPSAQGFVFQPLPSKAEAGP